MVCAPGSCTVTPTCVGALLVLASAKALLVALRIELLAMLAPISKPLLIEGLDSESGTWETPGHGRRYTEFQAGVQMANRSGPLNEIEYSEFVSRSQQSRWDLSGLLNSQVQKTIHRVAWSVFAAALGWPAPTPAAPKPVVAASTTCWRKMPLWPHWSCAW